MNAIPRTRVLVSAVLFSLFAAASITAVPASAASRSLSVTLQPRQTIAPGGVARYPFLIRTSGNVGQIRFAFSGAPGEARTSVEQLGANRYELSVSVPTSAPPGSFTVNVRTFSRAPSRSFAVYLDVSSLPTPPTVTPVLPPPPPTVPPSPTVPSFGIRADNPELAVVNGQTAAFGFTVDRSLGYTGDVSFTATGLPAGVTSNFSPNPTRGGTILYATPSPSTPNGRYTVTIRASSDALNAKFTSVILTVTTTPDFALVVPATTNLLVGGSASIQLGYRLVGATAPIVTLGVSGLPAGVSSTFTPNPTFGDVTLTFTATSAVPVGSYPINVFGVASTVTRSYPMTLNVVAPVGGFALSASPATLTVGRGSSGSYAVTVTQTGGFASPITFTVSGLPAGVTIGAGGTVPNVTFNVNVPLATAVGTFPLVLTGSSGTLSASIVLQLSIV